jgi:maltose/moltooligosaccharide transporter
MLTEVFSCAGTSEAGQVPSNVIYSFYVGGFVLLLTVLWSVFKTKEYSPTALQTFSDAVAIEQDAAPKFGLRSIFSDIGKMPLIMRKLGWVQFSPGLPFL